MANVHASVCHLANKKYGCNAPETVQCVRQHKNGKNGERQRAGGKGEPKNVQENHSID